VNKAVLAIVVVALVLIGGVVGFVLGESGDDETPRTGGTNTTGTTGPAGEGETLNGVNLTAYTPEGYAGEAVREDLERIREIGSTAVTIVPTWYMKNSSANTIRPDAAKTPSDTSLESVIGLARDTGLKVILKPHVDVTDETFRGDIQPADRAAWFDSYEDFIGHYADFASRVGADLFVVGTELKSVSGDTDPWRQVITTVESRFPGELTYAANWDEVDQVQFWDALDLIGVDAYYPLSSEGQKPSVEELVSAWGTPVANLETTSERWGKPVLLTEIGYPTQAGAAAHPFEVKEGEPEDQGAQATAYRAAFDAFAGLDWVRGMSWWDWRADPTGAETKLMKIGYPPEGKAAEEVLAERQ
jgi:hypothetical protein